MVGLHEITVYLNEASGVYHANQNCGPGDSREMTLLQASDRARACKRCVFSGTEHTPPVPPTDD